MHNKNRINRLKTASVFICKCTTGITYLDLLSHIPGIHVLLVFRVSCIQYDENGWSAYIFFINKVIQPKESFIHFWWSWYHSFDNWEQYKIDILYHEHFTQHFLKRKEIR